MTSKLADCQQRLGFVRDILDGPPQEGEGRDMQIARAFAWIRDQHHEVRIFVMGQLDRQTLITACRTGAAQWWEPMAAAAYFGRLDDLRSLRAAMDDDHGKEAAHTSFSSTMTWGCWDYQIAEGVPPVMDVAVLDQLFDWGADPLFKDYNSGIYFDKALEGSPGGIINSFIRHGAPAERAEQVRDQYINNGNYGRAREIQKGLGLGGFFTKVDDETLAETKYITHAGRTSQLRTVFNFGARRVNEIFESPGAAPAISGCNFDDYDRAAIDAARQTLEKLGGHPDTVFELAEKPRKFRLSR